MPRRSYPLILPAILALVLGVPSASADLLRVPLQYGGQFRMVTTKDGRIKNILLKQSVVTISEDYLVAKPEWPKPVWWGQPATIDGVEGRIFVSYLSPQVQSQVTIRLTNLTAKSARITVSEERVSSADGYRETFYPDADVQHPTILSEVSDPYTSRESIRVPVRRISLVARNHLRTGTLEFRFPKRGQFAPRSDVFTGLNLGFYRRVDHRWGLNVLTFRDLVYEGDLVYTRGDSNHGVLPGPVKIRPFVD